ncbi:Wzz/FepE/Etk N-terminal domain-containing protein [Marinobacter sp. 1_MG-2023]|uniref:Wzz/FepE/Etk N-terminal domain-containing protein n=1 Tax=Marinobacter sp. 1_MG-2023 TaxID=3062627 RepID=UPI0026E2D9C6|nr:Wzz/FepE/Etk N-terminal domain-containing protein [Marinobacter sp. 1_MG-2023]MDO6823292.1 Wzz/FepE/Etk N-terminal domain-containing protein [Marinobacter sp. 1_MG-2023]
MNEMQNTPPADQRPDYSDEISLVDLVATFVRRRRVFYVVFIFVTLAGLGYALWMPDEFEYVSLVQIAQKDSKEFVQPPETTIATLESRWLPEVQTRYRGEHGRKLPFDVVFNNPESTGLIRFESITTKDEGQAVSAAHSALINSVKDDQDVLIKSERQSLQRQIESVESAIETLKGEKDAGEAIAGAIERRSKLEGRLEGLQGVEVLVTSRQSAEKVAPKRSLIAVLAVLLGSMLGVFLAFMSEFVSSVREQVATESAGEGAG